MKIHLNYRHVHMTSSKAKVLNRLCISEPWTQGWNQDFDLITDAVTQCIMLVISAGYMQLSFEIKASKAGSIKFRIFILHSEILARWKMWSNLLLQNWSVKTYAGDFDEFRLAVFQLSSWFASWFSSVRPMIDCLIFPSVSKSSGCRCYTLGNISQKIT